MHLHRLWPVNVPILSARSFLFFTNYFFIEVLQGVQETLTSLGYDLIIHGANSQDQVDEYLQRSMRKGRVDGTLLFSLELSESNAEEILERKIPLVLVDTFHPKFDSIRVDNAMGAKIATEHLIALGHRSIGMINANLKSAPAKERLSSFRRTVTEHGLSINDDLIVNSSDTKNDGFSRESGYHSMKEFIARGTALPSAFFVSSDIQAIGVLAALREAGIRVPEDMAIVSFDDVELAKNFDLTTMSQPMFKMGELAVKKMLERIENPNAPVTSVDFKPTLVIRASCGANRKYVFHQQ
jgi:LacI family transcriptional regulator